MKLPKEITDKALQDFLIPGNIIRTEITYPDGGSSFKRIIILSSDNNKTVLGVVGTSKVINDSRFNRDKIIVSPEEEPVFEDNTVIQLHRVFEVSTNRLKKFYSAGVLNLLGAISDKSKEQIVEIIKNSDVIEQKHIDRICDH